MYLTRNVRRADARKARVPEKSCMVKSSAAKLRSAIRSLDSTIAAGCLKFITGRQFIGAAGPRIVNPITRTDLFWLAHVTQQKRGRPLIHFRRELKRRTCSRQQMRLPRQIIVPSSRTGPHFCMCVCVWDLSRALRHADIAFITFHNVFRRTHFWRDVTRARARFKCNNLFLSDSTLALSSTDSFSILCVIWDM